VFGALVAVGGIAITVAWLGQDRAEPRIATPVPEPQSDTDDRIALVVSEPPADPPPRPGSLRETLLRTSDGNRRAMLFQTLRDEGFDCSGIGSAGAIGDAGVAWRVNCGHGRIYTIAVTNFDEFEINPAPYGDLYAPVPINVVPRDTRTLELQER
jgi:hypothetical protein